MKLKINKACDLSSISVLPPHTRRPNAVLNRPQGSLLRSQPSEQSFSQGLSSQHGMFSQLSQNSLSDVLTNDQRFGSQEQENSVKTIACLPSISHGREESQMQISRSSVNLMHKSSSASVPVFQIIDNKGQEDFKASLDGAIKSMFEQLSKNAYEEKLQEILLVLSALPEKIEIIQASLLKSQSSLHSSFIKELQKLLCSQNQSTSIQTCEVPSILPPKFQGPASFAIPQGKPQPIKQYERKFGMPQPIKSSAVPAKVSMQAVVVPKTEIGG